MRTLPILALALALPLSAQQTWTFAVSGDSRNCGDVVMPAIADGVRGGKAAFYWHLGDFRNMANFDEDLAHDPKKPNNFSAYYREAWPDFIRNQIAPFAPVPVYLGIGNHELVPPKSRGDYVAQFADWLMQPPIVRQRLLDNPENHIVRPYYHWIEGGVDFISLDNASPDQFEDGQLVWFERLLARAETNPEVKAVVLGMHAALPHSLGCDHSMNESAQGEYSGTRVYTDLLKFRETTKKNVYVIASHSHFLLRDAYDSDYWRAHGGVLPGIIIGTAGAIRYRLPDTALSFPPERARTDTYGYLTGTVDPSGAIRFDFHDVVRADVSEKVVTRYGAELVDWCFAQNRDFGARSSKPCARADAPCGPAEPVKP
jgi:hypothetical protein